ncbi:heavy-metal-associated domain-containing protein [Maribacter confluentis]|uniref:Heavy-metal-associated domain-containing protein n=1 Tax=Maribacter confluentis TaxID=1656093 RepID=A0ABT8RKQ4_9FLAO|nr:heavy-metal-associated domain-containing protein [Maribacter confluentis]MDO1511509.1 heavy-metal-associated domain-containing protein [Maribacter confluentis]
MTSIIPIQNLKCGGCAKTIISKLEEIPAITNVSVNVELSSVSFEALKKEDIATVKSKLKSIGYPSLDEENSVLSKAKSFVSCASGKLAN